MSHEVERAFDAALARRAPLLRTTEVVRALCGDVEGAPGLVVDLYGAVARVERYDARADALGLARALVESGRVPGAVAWARPGRGQAKLEGVFGAVPAAHVVREDGARYLVRTRTPDAVGTGIFADHREGRRAVRAHAHGARVLNLFAHAGAFGVAALVGGAARVDQVDLARKCARWSSTNLALNGADPRAHRFLVEDALRFLTKAARRRAWDLVILDPPTTARTPRGRFVLTDAVPDLARDAVRALDGPGSVLFSCNARGVAREALLAALEAAARAEGRVVEEAIPLAPGEDFPPGADQPMRGVWVRLTAP